MRITRDLLTDAARDYVNQSIQGDRSIYSVYLIGSTLTEEPFIGGTTDIDLVYIHTMSPSCDREIHRFTDEVSLDIIHHPQTIYEQPRELRLDPIIGPPINSTRTILFDTQHWFEYTQAIITAQFNRPDHLAERVRRLLASSREYWSKLERMKILSINGLTSFLAAVETATNAIANLSGDSLTERRFMRNLAERCQTVGHPELCLEASSLLGFTNFDFSTLPEWIRIWESDLFEPALKSNVPILLQSERRQYYNMAVDSYFNEGQFESALWIILNTWTMFSSNRRTSTQARKDCLKFLSKLGFNKDAIVDKISCLDAYIDHCGEVFANWARENGV